MSRAWIIPMATGYALALPLILISQAAGWSSKSIGVPLLVLTVAVAYMHAEMARKVRLAKAGRAAGGTPRAHRRP